LKIESGKSKVKGKNGFKNTLKPIWTGYKQLLLKCHSSNIFALQKKSAVWQ
jgi:hypothetical protein